LPGIETLNAGSIE